MSDAFWKILALKGIKGGGDTPTQEKTVALDMANGNQIITSDDGKTMTQATVLKPTTMAAENIKSGVNIGGVVGSLEGKLPEEEKTVTITENGTTEVNATEGKVMTKVVCTVDVATENRIPQLLNKTITEITAEDLAGVTRIEECLFKSNKNLKKITWTDSILKCDSGSFYDCRIEYVYINDLHDWLKTEFNNNSGSPIDYNTTKIYVNNSFLESLVIPNDVILIHGYAFQLYKYLKSVVISDSVTKIYTQAFAYCKNLSNVILGNGLIMLSYGVFMECDSLKNITIPQSVTDIGAAALSFGTSTNKATITMPSTTPPNIQSNTFNTYRLNKIIVPKGTGDTYKAATNWSAFADYIEEAAE